MHSERGFTLIETVVTVGILAVVLAAGGFWMLGMHPGALAQATDDYDSAIASARALAMTSSNGATLVFAPRTGARAGFELRVYVGRPSGSGMVQPSNAMPVVSDATVSEKSLGAPPLAIFLAASGHVSGKAAYPTIDSTGNASFVPIASEPACPAGGFVLTFRGPQGATATRTLPCTTGAAMSTAGPPNPSPTPNVPIVTPTQLVYHWPAAAQQRFVATEWGYTHWFATTKAFACGAGVAQFPNVLPSPYSAAYSPSEAAALPTPPSGTPYSYPNSNGGSTNDAPAAFPLDPIGEGLCTATVVDDYGQRAQTDVQVMGWLTATYKGTAYTHLSATALSLPSSDLPSKGASVTLQLSKTYDTEALQPAVALDAACSPYVTATTSGGTTPGLPSATPAKASITLTLVTMPGSPISCGGTIYDQYQGSKHGEGISFNAAIAPPDPTIWPPQVHYPTPGKYVYNANGVHCGVNQPIAEDATGAVVTGSDASGRLQSGPQGCLSYKGAAVDMNVDPSFAVSEPGYSGLFYSSSNVATPCGSSLAFNLMSDASGPNGLASFSGKAAKYSCQIALTDSSDYVDTADTGAVRITDLENDMKSANGSFGHYADNGTCGGPLGGACYAYNFPILVQFNVTVAPDVEPISVSIPSPTLTNQSGVGCSGVLDISAELYDGSVSIASTTTGGVDAGSASRVALWATAVGNHKYSAGSKVGTYSLVIAGNGVGCATQNWEVDFSDSDTISQG